MGPSDNASLVPTKLQAYIFISRHSVKTKNNRIYLQLQQARAQCAHTGIFASCPSEFNPLNSTISCCRVV